MCNIRRLVFVATSFVGPTTSWFNNLSETDTQAWSIVSTKFLNHTDSAIIKFKVQAAAQIMQPVTHESISIYVCHVEDLVNKR